MTDIYDTPQADVNHTRDTINNSGMKEKQVPDGVKGWSWGAFFLNWIWAIGNKSWIGVFAILPYVGVVISIYLGIKGRELAWKNKRWESVEHFNRVQRSWSKWGLILVLGAMILGIVAAVMIPAYHDYTLRAQGL